jgi:predicted nucleotide-binding protein (sugar kinase/HSP70/actin superfamily)
MIYGVLSAVYIQQQSLMKLFQLFKLKKIKSEFDHLTITFLRHCISAHPVNFKIDNKEVCYKLVRSSLSMDGNIMIVDNFNEFTTYNIYDAIEEYEKLAEEKMEIISKRIVDLLFKTSKEKTNELNLEIENIKLEIKRYTK